MRSSKSIVTGVAVLAALALPMVAGAADKLIVQDGTIKVQSGGVDKVAVTDTGRVGVGVAAPSYPLHVEVPFAATMYFRSTGRPLSGSYNIVGDSANIYLMRNNDSTVNNGLPRANDRLGMFQFGSLISGVGNIYASGISSNAEISDWTSTSTPSNMVFSTTPDGTKIPYERLRITSSGAVGIGIATPTQRLEVNGGMRLKPTIAKPTCDSTTRGVFWYTYSTIDSVEVCAQVSAGSFAWKALF